MLEGKKTHTVSEGENPEKFLPIVASLFFFHRLDPLLTENQ